MYDTFVRTVERIVGRSVVTYQSQIAFSPELCFEFFALGDPLDGDKPEIS